MTVKLGSAYDKEDDGDIIQKDRPTPRPKDAATLILVRRDQAQPRLLMGKRSGRHTFMPDKYVFPGGRVDTADGRVPSLSEFRRPVEKKLLHKTRRKPRASMAGWTVATPASNTPATCRSEPVRAATSSRLKGW